MPGESYRRRLRSSLLYLCYVYRALINSFVCRFLDWLALLCIPSGTFKIRQVGSFVILSKHTRLDRLDRVQCYRNIREWIDWILCNHTETHKIDWILRDPTETQRLDRLDHVRHSERNVQDWTDWPILGSIPTETHKPGQIGPCAAFLPKHT